MKYVNILVELLRLLDVKYTTKCLINLCSSNPYRNSLYGLSMILSSYNIDNVAIRLKDKQQVLNIDPPFIAYASNDFVLVKQIKNAKVKCLFNNEYLDIALEEFVSIWSGVLLMIETNDRTIEPDYFENRKREFIDKMLYNLLWIIALLICVFYFVFVALFTMESIAILSALLGGIYVSFLLLQKQLKVQSAYADKLCSLFNKSNCNSVLESDAAKFLGVFSWSEIGFAYFVSTFFMCLVGTSWISYCTWINVCALPFSLWSVWYQRFKVKQWCPMCLIVMGIFWLLFIMHLYFGYFNIQSFDLVKLLWLMMLYALSLLIIHQSLSIFRAALSKQELVYELNNVKMNEDVFMALLKSNQYYDVLLSTSHIMFGNPKAKTLITILTNPHCEPCAKMHFRLNNLLNKASDKYCIQYIFSSFNESLSISNKILIAAYLRYGMEDTVKLYDKWFKEGKYKISTFLDQNNLEINESVEQEYLAHETWIKKTKLRTTPTILINGYELPMQYKIEDLGLLEIDWN